MINASTSRTSSVADIPPKLEPRSNSHAVERSQHAHRERNAKSVRVLCVGQTPPPIHGQALIIERVLKSQLDGVEMLHTRMNFSQTIDDTGRFRLLKILHLFQVVLLILYQRVVHRPDVLYYPPAGPHRVPFYRDAAVLLTTRWFFKKLVFHFHASGISTLYPRLSWPERLLYRLAYFKPDAVIRSSPFTAEDGRFLQATTEYIIPYGIPAILDGQAIANRNDGASGTQRETARPLNILFVGILRESKGALVLLEACGQLAQAGVPFQAEFLGEFQTAEFRSRVESRIRELGIEKSVVLAGTLLGREKQAAYSRADVFCFPTFYESEAFALVVVEAMSSGLPVVVTRWRGLPSLVRDGENGYLVDTHDVDAVAQRLIELAENPDLRLAMGQHGRERFDRHYTHERYVADLADMFQDIAGRSSESTSKTAQEANP